MLSIPRHRSQLLILIAAGIGWLPTAYAQDDPREACKKYAQQIRPGMTRAHVSKLMEQDGGIGVPYKDERYFFRGVYFANSAVCKLNIAFRPKGMPSKVYDDPDLFWKWLTQSRNPGLLKKIWRTVSRPFTNHAPQSPTLTSSKTTDEIVRVSAPYVDLMIAD